jgi:hypothetical protein
MARPVITFHGQAYHHIKQSRKKGGGSSSSKKVITKSESVKLEFDRWADLSPYPESLSFLETKGFTIINNSKKVEYSPAA